MVADKMQPAAKVAERKPPVLDHVRRATVHFFQLLFRRKYDYLAFGVDHTAYPIPQAGRYGGRELQGKFGFAGAAVATHDAGFANRDPVMCDPAALLDRHAFPLRGVEGFEG